MQNGINKKPPVILVEKMEILKKGKLKNKEKVIDFWSG